MARINDVWEVIGLVEITDFFEPFTQILHRWGVLAKHLLEFEAKRRISPVAFLARWRALRNKCERAQMPDLQDVAHRLIIAAMRYSAEKVKELQALVLKSEKLLYPLEDPMRIRFGLNRWLAMDREEAYSDWLAWVLEELGSADRVGRLLYGDSLPEALRKCRGRCKAEREVWVPTGHEGRTGRLDCVLRFGREAILVIEVKVVDAESSDIGKHGGYQQWLKDQQASFKEAILLATAGKKGEKYNGFELLLWADFCRRVRQILPELLNEGRITAAALMAGFISAVEQNLLAFPSLWWLGEDDDQRQALLLLDRIEKMKEYFLNILRKEGE